jgi:1,4-alpha-glucan branching enzyme
MVQPVCWGSSGQEETIAGFQRSARCWELLLFLCHSLADDFQGQELLEERWFHDKDPIGWSRIEGENRILSMYRDLIALRRNHLGLTRGLCGQNIHIYHFDNEAKVIAFHRLGKQGPTDSFIIVVNMSSQDRDGYIIGFSRVGLRKTRFNSDSYNYGPIFANHPTTDVETREEVSDGLPFSGEIEVGTYTVVIFS